MDTYYDFVVDQVRVARNVMVMGLVLASLLMVVMYFTGSFWFAIPALALAVWYRGYEVQYKHYKDVLRKLDRDADKTEALEH